MAARRRCRRIECVCTCARLYIYRIASAAACRGTISQWRRGVGRVSMGGGPFGGRASGGWLKIERLHYDGGNDDDDDDAATAVIGSSRFAVRRISREKISLSPAPPPDPFLPAVPLFRIFTTHAKAAGSVEGVGNRPPAATDGRCAGYEKTVSGGLWGAGSVGVATIERKVCARGTKRTRRNADNRMARVFPSARDVLSGRPPRALSDRRAPPPQPSTPRTTTVNPHLPTGPPEELVDGARFTYVCAVCASERYPRGRGYSGRPEYVYAHPPMWV